ncbi:MAG: hypothetical protein AAB214_21400 [Fibrobacterota bacterium]
MALGNREISIIEDLLEATEGGQELANRLRQDLQGVMVTTCDEQDIDNATPFRSHPSVRIHLVDGSNHCWNLTSDPSAATGLLLARPRKR